MSTRPIHMRKGASYKNGLGDTITIVDVDVRGEYPFVGDNRFTYNHRGQWHSPTDPHWKPDYVVHDLVVQITQETSL